LDAFVDDTTLLTMLTMLTRLTMLMVLIADNVDADDADDDDPHIHRSVRGAQSPLTPTEQKPFVSRRGSIDLSRARHT